MSSDQLQQHILGKLLEWAMPYSPVADNSLEKMNEEMKLAVRDLDEQALAVLAEIGMSERVKDDDFFYTYEDFLLFYFQHHNTEAMHQWLAAKLEHRHAYPIASMIGHTRNPNLYPLLVEKIRFAELEPDNKYLFLDALCRLKNRDAIPYLETLKATETDPEVIDDIRICIEQLG